MKNNSYQLLCEAVRNDIPWDGMLYHYIFDEHALRRILLSGKLLSTDLVPNPKVRNKYATKAMEKKLPGTSTENSDKENAQVYWKYMYDKLYAAQIGKPYSHYGIYLTPLDLFQFKNELSYRIKYDFNQIPGLPCAVQVDGWVKKVRTKDTVQQVMDKFTNYDQIENRWNTPGMKFKKLPQVVCFTSYLPVKKSNLERR